MSYWLPKKFFRNLCTDKLTKLSYWLPKKCIWILRSSYVITKLPYRVPDIPPWYMCTCRRLIIKSVPIWISYDCCNPTNDIHPATNDIHPALCVNKLLGFAHTDKFACRANITMVPIITCYCVWGNLYYDNYRINRKG